MTQKESGAGRIAFLDVLRGSAMAAVLIDHYYLILYCHKLIRPLAFFSVTLFVFAGGAASAASLMRRSHRPLWRYQIARLLALLVPYGVASVVYHLWNQGGGPDLPLLIKQLYSFSGAAPFYFVFFYLQLIAVAPLLFRCLARGRLAARLLSLFLVSLVAVYSNVYSLFPANYGGAAKLLGGNYLLVYAAGMFLFPYLPHLAARRTSWILLFVSSAGITGIFAFNLVPRLVSNPPDWLLMAYTCCIGAFAASVFQLSASRPLFRRCFAPLELLGRRSLYIFLYHTLFIELAIHISTSLRFSGPRALFSVFMVSMTLLPCLLIASLVKSTKSSIAGRFAPGAGPEEVTVPT